MTAGPGVDEAAEVRLSLAEPERFAVVFEAYFAEIHRYVAARLGAGAAEDVVADVFLSAFRNRSRYDAEQGGVRAWLYGIATHRVSRQRRVEVRALRAMGRQAPQPPAESPENQVLSAVTAQRLRPELARAIASLSERDRDVLLLVALAGLTHQEIAAALDIPYGTVGSRLNRARKKVRAVLGDTNPMYRTHLDLPREA
ncbi:RNA polymerase sigma factor [Sphaerisporangium corydalis]|uniref:RNA polymerase sigma factor n=1 Tax=Sphaerisporangium corydalis TaxID=1441875 RepID=A0ABV9EIW7_9ACTN|nr:RNA polymerase sigma factor [Sphaerisporangium corydalis]